MGQVKLDLGRRVLKDLKNRRAQVELHFNYLTFSTELNPP